MHPFHIALTEPTDDSCQWLKAKISASNRDVSPGFWPCSRRRRSHDRHPSGWCQTSTKSVELTPVKKMSRLDWSKVDISMVSVWHCGHQCGVCLVLWAHQCGVCVALWTTVWCLCGTVGISVVSVWHCGYQLPSGIFFSLFSSQFFQSVKSIHFIIKNMHYWSNYYNNNSNNSNNFCEIAGVISKVD